MTESTPPLNAPPRPPAEAVPAERALPAPPPTPQPVGPATNTAPSPELVERPHPLTPLIRGWLVLVALVWGFGRELLPDGSNSGPRLPPLNWLTVGLAVAVLGSLVLGYVEWRFTRFVVDQDELRVESGALTRTSQRVRFDRIQSIDILQPAAARIFGLAELKIDVGADGGVRLRFLTRARAGALRDFPLARAQSVRTPPADTAPTSAYDDLAATDEVLIRARPDRLVIGALLSHEMLFLAIPAFLIPAITALVDPRGAALIRENPWILLAPALPTLGLLWSFIARRVIGQWNYTLAQTASGLKITRGLTSLTSQSVPRHRVQALRIAQPLGWRALGLYRIDIAVLGMHGVTTDEDQAGVSSILMPIGTRADVLTAVTAIWPGVRLEAITVTGPPSRARWLNPLSYRWQGVGWDEVACVVRRGWLTRVEAVVPHARLQSWRLTADPLQRRLGLATVQLHTAALLWECAADDLEADWARQFLDEEANRSRAGRVADRLDPAGPTSPAPPSAEAAVSHNP